MKHADLEAYLLLVGFTVVKDHHISTWGRTVVRYKYGYVERGEPTYDSRGYLYMIDVHDSLIAEAFYSLSIDGTADKKTRSPMVVRDWVSDMLNSTRGSATHLDVEVS